MWYRESDFRSEDFEQALLGGKQNRDEKHDAATANDETAGQEKDDIVVACAVEEETCKIETEMKQNDDPWVSYEPHQSNLIQAGTWLARKSRNTRWHLLSVFNSYIFMLSTEQGPRNDKR